MLQFSSEQIRAIRDKASDRHLQQLIDDNQVVLNYPTLVPPDNRATWNLYYYCPEHGVRLSWHREKPTEHVCPVDGKTFTGEPYDGAWWRWLNGLNAKACNQLGLLWQLTGEQRYLDKVVDILLQYAKYYPDYEEHGGIPYNGPGKANAQTLCEANCHLDFALGYDFVREALTPEQQDYIEIRLLREGAEFLMAHRNPQLHNHEMKINATVGMIGLLLDDPHYLDFALNNKYGIHYQLEQGVKGEGLWFEGSIHYHYYALQALMAFEKLARNTPYSVRNHPRYYTMIAFPLHLIMNTGEFPRLNDCIAGQQQLTHTHLFEFAYLEFADPLFAQALVSIYQDRQRDNIDALLYGVDTLPDVAPLTMKPVHAPDVGITTFYQSPSQNSALLKHAPYGGEHDHYDRLGLIIIAQGKEILPDLGTTGYGAELHYGYYKNSATHNTLVVNQQNQTPANPELLGFEQQADCSYIDTLVDWRQPPAEVDSHTLVQWDQTAYQDVQFRRGILWLGDCMLQLDRVINPHRQQLDLSCHVRGELCASSLPWQASENPLQGPLARMHQCQQTALPLTEVSQLDYQVGLDNPYRQFISAQGVDSVLTGLAPDNPATSNLTYVLLRSQQSQLNAVMLHDLGGNCKLCDVTWLDDAVELKIQRGQQVQQWRLQLTRFGAELLD